MHTTLLARYFTCTTIRTYRSYKGYIHGHHDDYSKPLEVRWVCALCHKDIHRKLAQKTLI